MPPAATDQAVRRYFSKHRHALGRDVASHRDFARPPGQSTGAGPSRASHRPTRAAWRLDQSIASRLTRRRCEFEAPGSPAGERDGGFEAGGGEFGGRGATGERSDFEISDGEMAQGWRAPRYGTGGGWRGWLGRGRRSRRRCQTLVPPLPFRSRASLPVDFRHWRRRWAGARVIGLAQPAEPGRPTRGDPAGCWRVKERQVRARCRPRARQRGRPPARPASHHR